MWEDAYKFLKKDKYIGPLVVKWGKCEIKKRPQSKYFDSIASSIIEQQLAWSAAVAIRNRVVTATEGKNKKLLTPEGIMKTSDQTLRDCGMSWAKARYIKDLSEKVQSSKLKINSLDELSDEEVIEELVQVKGIGRWTAEMFLMFTLARADIFPIDDLGIKKGFEKVTGKKFDRKKSAKFAQKHWKPFRTVASWYLWRSLENK